MCECITLCNCCTAAVFMIQLCLARCVTDGFKLHYNSIDLLKYRDREDQFRVQNTNCVSANRISPSRTPFHHPSSRCPTAAPCSGPTGRKRSARVNLLCPFSPSERFPGLPWLVVPYIKVAMPPIPLASRARHPRTRTCLCPFCHCQSVRAE